jgi:HEPN domain-containing protein
MTKKEEMIAYWRKSAEADLVVAEHLFEKGDYHYCLFIGHLVLEKALKALYVKRKDLKIPYKHSLPLLAQKAGLELCEEQETFLEEVTDFNIEARYPDIKFSFFKRCTKEFTEDYFKRIKEFYQWLKVKIQLDES